MTPQHPVLRYNYFIQTDGELAWSSSIGPEDTFGMEAYTNKSNISIEEMYFRSERQTLRRLPRTGAILFTIRPYFLPIVEIAQEQGISGQLASAIRSWSDDVAQHRGKIFMKMCF
jgi:alpha-1,2-mannosyltransferase